MDILPMNYSPLLRLISYYKKLGPDNIDFQRLNVDFQGYIEQAGLLDPKLRYSWNDKKRVVEIAAAPNLPRWQSHRTALKAMLSADGRAELIPTCDGGNEHDIYPSDFIYHNTGCSFDLWRECGWDYNHLMKFMDVVVSDTIRNAALPTPVQNSPASGSTPKSNPS